MNRDGTSAGPGGRLGFIFRDEHTQLKVLLEGQTHNDWTGNNPRQNYRTLRFAASENWSRHEDLRLGMQIIPGDENYDTWLEWQLSYGRSF